MERIFKIVSGPARHQLFESYEYAFPGNFVHKVNLTLTDPEGRKFHLAARVINLDYLDRKTGRKFEVEFLLSKHVATHETDTSPWSEQLDGETV